MHTLQSPAAAILQSPAAAIPRRCNPASVSSLLSQVFRLLPSRSRSRHNALPLVANLQPVSSPVAPGPLPTLTMQGERKKHTAAQNAAHVKAKVKAKAANPCKASCAHSTLPAHTAGSHSTLHTASSHCRLTLPVVGSGPLATSIAQPARLAAALYQPSLRQSE